MESKIHTFYQIKIVPLYSFLLGAIHKDVYRYIGFINYNLISLWIKACQMLLFKISIDTELTAFLMYVQL